MASNDAQIGLRPKEDLSLGGTGLGAAEPYEAFWRGTTEDAIRSAMARFGELLPECSLWFSTVDARAETLFRSLASAGVDNKVAVLLEKNAPRKVFRDAFARLKEGKGLFELLNRIEPEARLARQENAFTVAQPVSDGAVALFAAWRPYEYGPFSSPDRARIAETAQFCLSLLRVRLQLANVAVSQLSQNLSRLDVAFVAFDPSFRVSAANAMAEKLFEKKDYVVCDGGRLSLADAAADARLRRHVEHFGRRAGDDASAIAMRKAGRGSLARCIVTALRDGTDAILGPPLFAITFSPERNLTEVEHGALRRLGLSPAETELALDLLKGMTVTQHAAARGIAVATSRAHLKRAMMRLGVNRQADLIRHLMIVL